MTSGDLTWCAQECHLDVWTYEVGVGSSELPDLLRKLGKLAADCHIDDWYISQNTLDSVSSRRAFSHCQSLKDWSVTVSPQRLVVL